MSLLSKCVSMCNWSLNGTVNDHRSQIKGKLLLQTHSVNYFQRWHMGTTNKLLQTALWKWTHSSRQPEVAIVTKSFKECSIINNLDGTEGDILWDQQHDKSDSDEEGDDMYDDTWTDTTDVQWRQWWWWIFGFWINLQILVCILYTGLTLWGFIGPKTLCILYTSVYCNIKLKRQRCHQTIIASAQLNKIGVQNSH